MSGAGDRRDTLVTIARVAYEEEVQHPAATLAYYQFVSLLPLLLLAVAAVSEPLAFQIQAVAPRVLAPGVSNLVFGTGTLSTDRTGAVVFAVLVLMWSGYNIVDGFETVVERVENVSRPVHPVWSAVAVILTLALTLLATLLTSAVVVLMPDIQPLTIGAGVLALLAGFTAALLPLYYIPSRTVTSLRQAVPGALTAAAGWTGTLLAIHLYAVNAGQFALYGVLSGVIIVLTGLYFGSAVLLLGVVVNAVLAGEGSDPTAP